MTGAGAVVALVLLEWVTGWVGTAAWTQSWAVVSRGHFRIMAWCALSLVVLTLLAVSTATSDGDAMVATAVLAILCAGYLAVQWSRTDLPGTVVGAVAAVAGLVALLYAGGLLDGWSALVALPQLVAGALLLGGVSNGMLLGHWYLNQPGLKPWALARLTNLALVATVAAGALGIAFGPRLVEATTEGAAFGLEGFGESFGIGFYLVWLALIVLTATIVWAARRCVRIRSIQSATGLYYVALLSAGVAEFLVRYLMVNVR